MFYLVAGLSSVSVCCGEEGASSPSWGSSSHSASHLSSSNSSVIWRQMTQRFNVWKLMQTRTKIVFIINAKAEECWPEDSHTGSSYSFDISSNKLSSSSSSLLGLSCPLSLKPEIRGQQFMNSTCHPSFFPKTDTMLCLPSFFLSFFLPSAQKQTHLLLSPCRRHGNPPFPMLWLAVVKFSHGSMCRSREEDDSQHQKVLWVCTSACLSARKVHFPASRD